MVEILAMVEQQPCLCLLEVGIGWPRVEEKHKQKKKNPHVFYAYKGKSESHEDWVPLVYSWFCHRMEKRRSLRKVSVM